MKLKHTNGARATLHGSMAIASKRHKMCNNNWFMGKIHHIPHGFLWFEGAPSVLAS